MKYIVKKIEGDEYLCPWTRQTKQKEKKKKKERKHNTICVGHHKTKTQYK